jgi:hypothetical protein
MLSLSSGHGTSALSSAGLLSDAGVADWLVVGAGASMHGTCTPWPMGLGSATEAVDTQEHETGHKTSAQKATVIIPTSPLPQTQAHLYTFLTLHH